MEKLSYADIISSLALFTAIVALLWNIIRDLIIDKVSVKIHIAFGETGNIKDSSTALFAEAGSLKPNHKFSNTGMLVKIINIGRRSIVVCGVGGELNNGSHFSMAVKGLPRILKPYEEFSNISEITNSFMDIVKNNEIKKIWAEDTKGGKWLLSDEGFKNFKKTADYINSGKHL